MSECDGLREKERIELLNAIAKTPSLIPCVREVEVRHYWTSGKDSELSKAAALCQGCAVIAQCRAYGITWSGEYGVYGGLQPAGRSKPRGRPGKQRGGDSPP